MKSERTPSRYKQVYKYRWAGRLCRSLTPRVWQDYKPLEARWLRLIYCLGEAGRKKFFCDKVALMWFPLKHTVWFWSPTLAVEDFMFPPLQSEPPQKASVTICKQVTSILILTSHEGLNNNFTYLVIIWYELNCLWRVTLLIQKSLKTNSLSFSSSSLSNSSSYSSSSDSPSLSPLAPHDSSVFTDSLCVGNNDIE